MSGSFYAILFGLIFLIITNNNPAISSPIKTIMIFFGYSLIFAAIFGIIDIFIKIAELFYNKPK